MRRVYEGCVTGITGVLEGNERCISGLLQGYYRGTIGVREGYQRGGRGVSEGITGVVIRTSMCSDTCRRPPSSLTVQRAWRVSSVVDLGSMMRYPGPYTRPHVQLNLYTFCPILGC